MTVRLFREEHIKRDEVLGTRQGAIHDEDPNCEMKSRSQSGRVWHTPCWEDFVPRLV